MKAEKYRFFVLYALLLVMHYHMSAMEHGLINFIDGNGMNCGNKIMLKKFEVGTRMGGVVTRIFCLDQQTIRAIDVCGKANVALCQVGSDEEESLTVKAEEDIINYLPIAIVDKHTLAIGQNFDNGIRPTKGILYCIALKNITHISCNDLVKIVSLSPIKTNELWLTLQDQSTFIANGAYGIDTDMLSVTLKDSSSVSLSGRARHQKLYIGHSAEYDAQALETNTVCVEAGGTSKVKVHMVDFPIDENSLDISGIYGSMTEASLLEYSGKPFTRVQCKDSSLLRQIIQEK